MSSKVLDKIDNKNISNNSLGIKYMLIAALFFTMMKICVKSLENIPSYEVVLFRAIVSFTICYYLLKKSNINPWGNHKFFLILRGLFGTFALLIYFYTIQNIPLATAVALQKLSPIFTVMLAVFILKEKITLLQVFFFLISFSGLIFIKGIEIKIPLYFIILGVIAAFFSGVAYNLVRKLKDYDHHLVVVFYFPLLTLPIIGPYTIYYWVQPHGTEWILLILVGIFTQIAQVNLTKAYQIAEISKVAIFSYLDTVFAILLGYLLFGEMLGISTLIGIILIITGAILSTQYKKS